MNECMYVCKSYPRSKTLPTEVFQWLPMTERALHGLTPAFLSSHPISPATELTVPFIHQTFQSHDLQSFSSLVFSYDWIFLI